MTLIKCLVLNQSNYHKHKVEKSKGRGFDYYGGLGKPIKEELEGQKGVAAD